MNIEISMGETIQTFSTDDIFLDNKACVQVVTRYGYKYGFGFATHMILNKRELAGLELKCDRVQLPHHSGSECELFKYKLKEVSHESIE